MTDLPATFDPAWRTRLTWIGMVAPAIAAVVLAVLLVAQCNGKSKAERELARLKERPAITATGLPAADQFEDVTDQFEALKQRVPALEEQLRKLTAAVGKVNPRRVVSAETKPAPVGGTPRPADPAAAPAPVCVLALGDSLKLKMAEADVDTKGGNIVILGMMEAWRMAPGPPTLLLQEPFSGPATSAVLKAPSAEGGRNSWRWGPLGGISTAGWAAGLLVVTPEVRLPIIHTRNGWSFVAAGNTSSGFLLTGPTF